MALLGQMLGCGRIAAEPTAAAELARTCANLPLALRIAGAGLVDQPHRAIAGYVAELAAGNPVVALSVEGDDDTSVRNAFDLSYRAQPESAQRMFRCLGRRPARTSASAPSPLSPARRSPGAAHDGQAGQRTPRRSTQPWPVHHARPAPALRSRSRDHRGRPGRACGRQAQAFDWYVSMSVVAAGLLYPEVLRVPVPTGFPAAMPGLTGAGPARDWLDIERHNLIAVILHTARHGPANGLAVRRCATRLPRSKPTPHGLADHLPRRPAAARADADPHAQAAAYHGLAHAHYSLGHYRRSVTYLRRTLALASEAGWDQAEAAAASQDLAIALHLQGRTTESVDCLRRALDVHGRINWPIGRARATVTLATAYRDIGRAGTKASSSLPGPESFTRGPLPTSARPRPTPRSVSCTPSSAGSTRPRSSSAQPGRHSARTAADAAKRAAMSGWRGSTTTRGMPRRGRRGRPVRTGPGRRARRTRTPGGRPPRACPRQRGPRRPRWRHPAPPGCVDHRPPDRHPAHRGRGQLGLPTAHFCLGDHDAALQYAAKALTLARQAACRVEAVH